MFESSARSNEIGAHGMELTVESVAAYVKGDTPIEPLVERLRAEPDKADEILTAFASSHSVDRRSWVSWAALQVLPHDRVVVLLTKLASSRDPDVSDDALFTLLEFDRPAAMKLLPRIRRKLRSKDIYEPVAAMCPRHEEIARLIELRGERTPPRRCGREAS